MFTTYIFSIIKMKKMNKAAVSPYIECHTKSREQRHVRITVD